MLLELILNLKQFLQHQIIDNKKTKIESFLRKTIKSHRKKDVLVAFENTGVYGGFLASSLNKMNIDYCSLSALEIHKSIGIKRGKSDKMDALIITN